MTPETRKLVADSLRLAADRLEAGEDCFDDIVPMALWHDPHCLHRYPEEVILRTHAFDRYEPEPPPLGDEELNDSWYRFGHPTEALPQWGVYITMIRSYCSTERDKDLGYGTKTVTVWQK